MRNPRILAVQPVLGCGNVLATAGFFERLGFSIAFLDSAEDPRYAALRRDGVELHLQWQDAASWAPGGDRPVYRFLVADVDGLFQEFSVAGVASDLRPVWDTAWGTREFHVRDPDGNGLQFYVPLQA